MAGLQERNGSYRVIFRHEGKQRSVTLGKISSEEAESRVGAIDLLRLRIRQQLVKVPPGVTIEEFLLSDGRAQSPAAAPEDVLSDGPIKFSVFKERHLEARAGGSMEAKVGVSPQDATKARRNLLSRRALHCRDDWLRTSDPLNPIQEVISRKIARASHSGGQELPRS
jgi:hypothetical protein